MWRSVELGVRRWLVEALKWACAELACERDGMGCGDGKGCGDGLWKGSGGRTLCESLTEER